MEYLVFFAVVVAFLIILFVREAIQAKEREKKFIASLHEKFGELPQREYSLERYARISRYYEKHRQEGQLDDITWNDLNMDDIFKRMNYTFSAAGEEYLYYKLRSTGTTQTQLQHFEEVAEYFRTHENERVKVQFLMNQLGYMGKFSLYDYIDNLDYLGERSNKKHHILNFLFIPLLIMMPFQVSLSVIGLSILIIYNIVSYFKEKNEIEPYITSFAYVMRLLTVCEKLIHVNIPVCKEEWEKLRKHKSALQNMRKGSFWVFSSSRGTGSGNPLEMIMDYVRMIFHVDLIRFNKMLFQLRLHIADVDELITCVGYVETAIAISALRTSLEEYCVPEFEREEMHIKEAYHPLIKDPVKNSISVNRGVLLTGSNASGKSTFLKTVALNAILAQTIHTCTASEYRAQFYDIYSSMSLRDSIESGESYYIVEIKALKRILDAAKQSGRSVLCFVDEVLRGTNTVERIAASTQILKSLTGSGIMCFAATHDIEMTELLKEHFENYHFEEDVREGDIFFNYKLMSGKATTRNAIKLLEIMGYRAEIIEKASRQAERFVETGKWEMV